MLQSITTAVPELPCYFTILLSIRIAVYRVLPNAIVLHMPQNSLPKVTMHQLTPPDEAEFIARFVHPLFRGDHRTLVTLLLRELKAVSSELPIELRSSGLGQANKDDFARIRGRLKRAKKPIIWQLCAPRAAPNVPPSHYEVELLPRQAAFLRQQGLLSAVAALASSVNGKVGDGPNSPVIKIDIPPRIQPKEAAEIANMVAKIVSIVLPAYP